MTELFSVHLKRKTLIYSGVTFERVEEHLSDEIIHDLPMRACQSYREAFGDQVIAIFPSPRSARAERRASREEAAPRADRRAPASHRHAAGSGYADAINHHLRRSA